VEQNILPSQFMEIAKQVKMTDSEKQQSIVKAKTFLCPGDIVVVKTPNIFYGLMRKLTQNEYDHTVVVVDEERCLHISYPTAKLVPSYLFMHVSREPIIIRTKEFAADIAGARAWSGHGVRDLFVFNVMHNSVGKGYDNIRVTRYMQQKMGHLIKSSKIFSTVKRAGRGLGSIFARKADKDSHFRKEEEPIVLQHGELAKAALPNDQSIICSH
jgi:hypothetical protein